jgi:branched-chain amino acid transport system permease protein
VFSQIIVTTLTLGAIYALIGVSVVVMFRATGVLSFAQGAFLLIGSLLFYTLATHHLGLYLSLIISCLVVGAIGVLVYLIFFQFAEFDLLFVSLATVGAGTAIEAAVTLIWGSNLFQPPAVVPAGAHHIIGNFIVTDTDIVEVVLAIILVVGLVLLIHRTPIGLRMRAVANDGSLASYGGVRVRNISAFAWGLSAAVAAAAGIGYTLGQIIDPSTLPGIGLVVFPAIIIGGMDSIGGVAVGSLLLALIETLAATYLGTLWQDVAAYILLLVILWIRPSGFFGSKTVTRV